MRRGRARWYAGTLPGTARRTSIVWAANMPYQFGDLTRMILGDAAGDAVRSAGTALVHTVKSITSKLVEVIGISAGLAAAIDRLPQSTLAAAEASIDRATKKLTNAQAAQAQAASRAQAAALAIADAEAAQAEAEVAKAEAMQIMNEAKAEAAEAVATAAAAKQAEDEALAKAAEETTAREKAEEDARDQKELVTAAEQERKKALAEIESLNEQLGKANAAKDALRKKCENLRSQGASESPGFLGGLFGSGGGKKRARESE